MQNSTTEIDFDLKSLITDLGPPWEAVKNLQNLTQCYVENFGNESRLTVEQRVEPLALSREFYNLALYFALERNKPEVVKHLVLKRADAFAPVVVNGEKRPVLSGFFMLHNQDAQLSLKDLYFALKPAFANRLTEQTQYTFRSKTSFPTLVCGGYSAAFMAVCAGLIDELKQIAEVYGQLRSQNEYTVEEYSSREIPCMSFVKDIKGGSLARYVREGRNYEVARFLLSRKEEAVIVGKGVKQLTPRQEDFVAHLDLSNKGNLNYVVCLLRSGLVQLLTPAYNNVQPDKPITVLDKILISTKELAPELGLFLLVEVAQQLRSYVLAQCELYIAQYENTIARNGFVKVLQSDLAKDELRPVEVLACISAHLKNGEGLKSPINKGGEPFDHQLMRVIAASTFNRILGVMVVKPETDLDQRFTHLSKALTAGYAFKHPFAINSVLALGPQKGMAFFTHQKACKESHQRLQTCIENWSKLTAAKKDTFYGVDAEEGQPNMVSINSIHSTSLRPQGFSGTE